MSGEDARLDESDPDRRPVCVIGLGLIGGSVLRVAAGAGRPAWGAAGRADAASARADGFDAAAQAGGVADALGRAAEHDALVVLAVPLPAVEQVLALVARHAPGCRLTDVVSVKQPVADAVARLAPAARYVGGHPMAGTARSGWAAGSARLFEGARWVVAADDGVPLDVWRDVASLAFDAGAQVVPAAADEHDAAVARVSHLPHLLAAVLASVAAEGGPLALSLAAGSFRDAVRVAGTAPELVTAMCEGNAGALLPAMDDALGRLGATRGSLGSTGAVAATVRAGHQAWQQWSAVRAGDEGGHRDAGGEPGPGLDALLAGDPATVPARLRALGRAGGTLTG